MASNDLLSNPDRLLSVEELAGVTGVPLSSIRKWAAKGTGPRRLRIGKYIRYRASDVRVWLDTLYTD
jgi:predicted DNA-binding transcriptional regulator AlpA